MKNPTREATIIAKPAKANVRGPPKIPMKKATTPKAHSNELMCPAIFDIPVKFPIFKKYQIARSTTTEDKLLEILLKKFQRPFPRQFCGFGVVAWGGVVVEAVLFAFVGIGLVFFLVLF